MKLFFLLLLFAALVCCQTDFSQLDIPPPPKIPHAEDMEEIQRYTDFAEENCRRGEILESITHFSTAITLLEEKYKATMESWKIMHYLITLSKRAQVYISAKQYENSKRDLDTILQIIKQNSRNDIKMQMESIKYETIRKRAETNYILGKLEAALQDLETFQDEESQKKMKRATTALTIQKQAETARGTGHAALCVELFGLLFDLFEAGQTNTLFHLKRAECAFAINDSKTLLADLKMIFEKEQQNIPATALYARYLYRIGSVDLALEQVNICLQWNSESERCNKLKQHIQKSEVMLTQGMTYLETKEYRNATKLFYSYLKVTKRDTYNLPQVYLHLCRSWKELGYTFKAIKYCSTVIRTYSGFVKPIPEEVLQAYELRAAVLVSINNLNAAKRDVRKLTIEGRASVKELMEQIDSHSATKLKKFVNNSIKWITTRKNWLIDNLSKFYSSISKTINVVTKQEL